MCVCVCEFTHSAAVGKQCAIAQRAVRCFNYKKQQHNEKHLKKTTTTIEKTTIIIIPHSHSNIYQRALPPSRTLSSPSRTAFACPIIAATAFIAHYRRLHNFQYSSLLTYDFLMANALTVSSTADSTTKCCNCHLFIVLQHSCVTGRSFVPQPFLVKRVNLFLYNLTQNHCRSLLCCIWHAFMQIIASGCIADAVSSSLALGKKGKLMQTNN